MWESKERKAECGSKLESHLGVPLCGEWKGSKIIFDPIFDAQIDARHSSGMKEVSLRNHRSQQRFLKSFFIKPSKMMGEQ